MTEFNPTPAPGDPQPPTSQPPADVSPPPGAKAPEPAGAPNTPAAPKKKRRRRIPIWLSVVGVVVLLLALLVLFAPMIASTGPVRSFVLARINETLNGRVEADRWSLGWTSGLKATGVRVFDASGRQILQLSSLTTELSLLDVVRGNYTLGDVVIDGLDFLLRREPDGQFNFAKLARAKPPASPQPSPSQPPAPADAPQPATKLPDLSGNLIVRNSRGTYEDMVTGQTVQFPSIEGTVKVPDINGPIDNALTLVAVAGGGQRGTLKITGTADVIENNEVHVETANVDEAIALEGLGTSAVAAFLPPGTIDRMDGVTSATVTLKVAPGQSAVFAANVTMTNLAMSGPALKGDTFTARELWFDVPPTRIDSGFGTSWADRPIRTGLHEVIPITLVLKQDDYNDVVTLRLDGVTARSLVNVAANSKPGAGGEARFFATIDVGRLARQLPHVMPERDGRRLSSGFFQHYVGLKLGRNYATVNQELRLTQVAVTRTSDGAVEKLRPIEQRFDVTTFGGGWSMPDLRQLKLSLTSGFAEGKFEGEELAQLKGSLTGDLAKAQRELGFLLPLDDVRLAGTFDVKLTSSGDVATAAAPLDLALTAVFRGLQLDGIAGFERFQQGYTRLHAGAQVVRGDKGVQALNGVRVVAQTGRSEEDLTVDSELTAEVKYVDSTQPSPVTGKPHLVRVAEVPEYTLKRLTADLAAAQRDFPAQFAALNEQGLLLESGALSLTGSGSYRANAIAFDVKGGVEEANLTKAPQVISAAPPAPAKVPPATAAAARTPVLRDYALALDAAGTHAPGDASGDASGMTRFTRLSITDNQKMFSLAKGEQDLVIATGAAGAQPAGEVRLFADVKKLTDLSKSISREGAQLAGAGADEPQAAELQSGRLDAVLQLGPAAQGLLALNGTIDLTNLTVRTEAEPIENETIAIVLRARSKSDFSQLSVDQATATGRLVNAKVTDTVLDFAAADAPDAPVLAMVPKADVVVELTNLRDLHALCRAISPPEPEVLQPEPQVPLPVVRDDAPSTPAPAPEPRRRRFEAPAPPPRAAEPPGDQVIGRRPGRAVPVEPRRELPAGPADPDGTVTLAPADDAPPPPAQIREGTATIRLTLAREGGQVVLTSNVAAKSLAFRTGDVFREVGDVDFNASMRLVAAASAPADAGFLEGLRELTVPTLVVSGAGAQLKLEQPLVVRDPAVALGAFGSPTTRPSAAPEPAGDAAVLSAVLNGTIALGELLPVLEALKGAEPGTMYPYAGAMTLRQELTTAGGAFRLSGRADVKDFAMTGEGAAAKFAERHVGFANAIALDPRANVLRIENLALAMEDTKAVQLTASGTVHELDTARRFEDMLVKIDYDAGRLWDVLRPLLDPETGGKSLEEITLAGKRVQEIRIEGAYPADDPNAIGSLRASGGLALETLATRGLTVSDLDLRFLLENGVLLLEHANPPPQGSDAVAGAACNGGTLSFQGLTIDLNGEHPRLDVPDGHPLIRNATINPIVADSIIGRFVNPAFAGADRARGMLDVTVVSCTGLALDSAMQSPDPEVSGRAELTWSLTDLMLGQPQLVALVTRLKPNALNEPGFEGEIKDGRIVIEGGQVYSDMTFQINEYALGFNGGIGLAQNELVNFSVALPPSLFAAIDEKFEPLVPKGGYKVALTGTTDNWIGNATNSILPIVADLGVKSALGRVFNRESDEEKAERRRRERERREARRRGEDVPADAAEPRDEASPDDPADEPRPDDVIGRRPTPGAEDGEKMDPDAPAAEAGESDDPLGNLLDRAIEGIGKRETDAEKKARRERNRREREERQRREREQQETPRQ